jgi:hypothetical protein
MRRQGKLEHLVERSPHNRRVCLAAEDSVADIRNGRALRAGQLLDEFLRNASPPPYPRASTRSPSIARLAESGSMGIRSR